MTPADLISTLATELRIATAGFTLQAEYQQDKKISVYEGYIPSANLENETFLPLITVEMRGSEDTEDGAAVNIGFMIAVYGGENAKYDGGRVRQGKYFKDYGDGWRDLLNIAETVRQYLWTRPDRYIGGKYKLVNLLFVPQSDNPEPFFYGDMVATFYTVQPYTPMDYPAEFEESRAVFREQWRKNLNDNNIYWRKQQQTGTDSVHNLY